jgi:hypothetical protein
LPPGGLSKLFDPNSEEGYEDGSVQKTTVQTTEWYKSLENK